MSSRKVAVLSALALTLVVGLMMFGPARTRAAGPWYVSTTGNDGNDCLSPGTACLTIQAAIIKASAGDTINVAAGNYAVVGADINKPLTLSGAQAGVDARDGRPAALESVITTGNLGVFILDAANITFDGFTFSNLQGRTLDTYFDADNFTMRNCILGGNIGTYVGGGIQFGGGPGLHANGLMFEQNLVTADNGVLLYMGHSMDNGTVRNNKFHGDTVTFGPFGNRTGWLIEGNEFDGDVPGHGPYWGFAFNANLGDVIIRNNNVHKMLLGLGQFSVVGGSITGNTFDDNQFAAFQLWGGEFGSVVSGNVQIECNTIKYNGTTDDGTPPDASHAIRLRPGLDASTIHIHHNNFTNLGAGSGWAIRQNGSGTADAELNWWGTTNPVVIAAMFGQGAVDFEPFLTAPVADADNDGILDPCDTSVDQCPGDPNKTEPGQCGCGFADTDTDGDGTADCIDSCPIDPNKIAPGACGCGVPDTDTDGDGTADCNDTCPNDPNKTAPGACGCGVPDTDSDGDGVANCHDNCPTRPNTSQADADHDGIGDACEAGADLRVTKTAKSKVKTGTKLTYVVTVRNNGPNSAPNVVITDTIPAGTTFVSAYPTRGSCSNAGNLVTCNIGNLANHRSAAIIIVVKVTAPNGTILNNTAQGSSSHPDPNLSNNADSARTKVVKPNDDDHDDRDKRDDRDDREDRDDRDDHDNHHDH